MAPPKALKANSTAVNTRSTRSQLKSLDISDKPNINGKRKGEGNEEKPSKRARPALGNITNATLANETELRKNGLRNNAIVKPDLQRPALRSIANVTVDLVSTKKNVAPANNTVSIPITDNQNKPSHPLRLPKVMTRAASRAKATVTDTETITKSVASINKKSPPSRRISDDFNNTDGSLYLSACEDSASSKLFSSLNDIAKRTSLASNADSTDNSLFSSIAPQDDIVTTSGPPPGVIDFDQRTPNDPNEVSEYTMDIFNYLKDREKCYPITHYMDKQVHMTKWMRMLVVDWMVEIQETFELNHETLYLAVKILDAYLGRKVILKDNLQLLGAAALLIASKFDERTQPMIDDFVYICDGVYSNERFRTMEIEVFKTINYDLGFPLSYRFVRRYARCALVSLQILTLARYILEYSLMDYDLITLSDSKMASAALHMALRMSGLPGWNLTLEYYSGYKFVDFADIMLLLNNGLHRKQKELLKTVRNKYSHKLFFEAAKVPLMSNEKLLEGTELRSLYLQNQNSA